MRRTFITSMLTSALVAGLFVTGPAIAHAVSKPGAMFNRALATFIEITGDTMTGTLTFSGVTTDITAASGEDVRIQGGASSGSVVLRSIDDVTDIEASDGDLNANIETSPSNTSVLFQNTGAAGGVVAVESQQAVVGSAANRAASEMAFCVGDGMTAPGTRTLLSCWTGTGVERQINQAALTITSPTDTTTSPLAGGSDCAMSSSGAAAWTPSETSALSGMRLCCTNSGANEITMTDSDGVYEGPGSVVGQYDTVCFRYHVDRWVEDSFSNNEP